MDYTKFLSILQNICPEAEKILPENRLVSDLGLCSFDMMMLLFQLENECGYQIYISTIKQDITVKELFDLISKTRNI